MIFRGLALCALLSGCVATPAPVGPPQSADDCKTRYDQARNAGEMPQPSMGGTDPDQTLGSDTASASPKDRLKQCLADVGAMSGIIPANLDDTPSKTKVVNKPAANPRKIPAQSRPQPVRRSAEQAGCNLEMSGGSGYVCRRPRY